MPVFTIDAENNIAALAEQPVATDGCQAFASEKELTNLTADWPAARLAEIWNSFAGVAPFDDLKPVKKFTDRASAVARIWKAIQRLGANVAPQSAPVAKKAKGTTKKASSAKKPTRAKQGARAVREGSKKATVLELLRRKQGATLADIMKATGWQAHSVRGFISGALGTKMGLTIESAKRDDGERVYSIAK